MSTLRTLWDAAGEQRLIELANKGLGTKQIAALMGVPYQSVSWKRKQLRLAGRLPAGKSGPKGPKGPMSDHERVARKLKPKQQPIDDEPGAEPPPRLEAVHLRPATSLSPAERKLMRRWLGW